MNYRNKVDAGTAQQETAAWLLLHGRVQARKWDDHPETDIPPDEKRRVGYNTILQESIVASQFFTLEEALVRAEFEKGERTTSLRKLRGCLDYISGNGGTIDSHLIKQVKDAADQIDKWAQSDDVFDNPNKNMGRALAHNIRMLAENCENIGLVADRGAALTT